MTAIYPGSFDPVTYGHLDIIKRAASFSDRLIVAVADNSAKKPLFSVNERIDILKQALTGIDNAEVESFSGLLVDYAKNKGTNLVIRGLRAVTDFEYEFQMALANRLLNTELETLFISASVEYLFMASSIVKEIARHGGDISKMVPDFVCERVNMKMRAGQVL